MVNTSFLATAENPRKSADAPNSHDAPGYSLSDEQNLAQIVVSGTFNKSFYCSPAERMGLVKELVEKVSTKFLGQLAVYGSDKAYMKDVPAYLVAYLASKDIETFKKVFPMVIYNGKMLRNFVKIIRSGETGRKSLGTALKKAVAKWIESADTWTLLNASIGNNPSLKDIISLSHPKPTDDKRSDFYQWLSGREFKEENLPEEVQALLKFRRGEVSDIPNVPFMYLLSENMNLKNWCDLVVKSTWQQLRMNLNVFIRNGVLDAPHMEDLIAEKLNNKGLIEKGKVFPYQIYSAYISADLSKYPKVAKALEDCVQYTFSSVPTIETGFAVLTDISGSMMQPIHGSSSKVPSKITHVDVAGLITSVLLANGPNGEMVLFNSAPVVHVRAREIAAVTVFELTKEIKRLARGGTNCSAPLKYLNDTNSSCELIIFISDNESWIDDKGQNYAFTQSGAVLNEWKKYKNRLPNAKLICIDIEPNKSFQVPEDSDILHVSGFSDQVFKVISDFLKGEKGGLVEEIKKVTL